MSFYINTLVGDAHRMQLIREAEAFRRGRQARKSAALARKARRHVASIAVAEPVIAPAVAPVGRVAGVYCSRAAAFAACTSASLGGTC